MMNLHYSVANRKTRSDQSWLLNEKMILNKKGFLVKVTSKNQTISYSFFFHNHIDAAYFSSCTNREAFKFFNNISHKTIWKAIEYLKKIKCVSLSLGHTNTLFSDNKIISERSNIERFTASFGGNEQIYIVYKKLPKNI